LLNKLDSDNMLVSISGLAQSNGFCDIVKEELVKINNIMRDIIAETVFGQFKDIDEDIVHLS